MIDAAIKSVLKSRREDRNTRLNAQRMLRGCGGKATFQVASRTEQPLRRPWRFELAGEVAVAAVAGDAGGIDGADGVLHFGNAARLSGSTQLHRLLMERLGFGFEAA